MGYLQFSTGTLCALVSSSVVPTAERCVLVWLAPMTDPGTAQARVSVSELAEEFRVDRRTAGRWLKSLDDAGMIRRGIGSRYWPGTASSPRAAGWTSSAAGRWGLEP
jgi:DNA-binding transcriptional ArsR family regulator